MGGLCSKRSLVDKSPSESTLNANGLRDHESIPYESKQQLEETVEKGFPQQPLSCSDRMVPASENKQPNATMETREPQLLRAHSQKSRSTKTKSSAGSKTGLTKASEVGSLLGKAGSVGLGKAVEVLDTLGSSVTSLSLSSGFVSGATKGNKLFILAFEVANTIVKGSNLMQSLSRENIKHLKEIVLPSEGVQRLISKDMDELLRIAAADKREELKVFSGEVVRFGNRCKDPQWHNLDRYFNKLGSEISPQKQLKDEAPELMQQLMTLVQYTANVLRPNRSSPLINTRLSARHIFNEFILTMEANLNLELYHELHALDRLEQDYQRKQQEEENTNVVQRGDNLQLLRQELKSQRKHVNSLQKRSLWSKILEEVIEKLVDIAHFLHLEICDAFGSADGDKPVMGSFNSHQTLGSAGLALHYANIITQIDTLVSRSGSMPANSRDALYQSLPPAVKGALRSRLQSIQFKEELTVAIVKAEMEKTLRWLVPLANNTTKAHHGFGWVGEWANNGTEMNRKSTTQTDLIRIETLHHANKDKTEAHILDLVVWLHHLIRLSRPSSGNIRSPIKSPVRSPSQNSSTVSLPAKSPTLTDEDQKMLRDVNFRKLTPGISKSQEFDISKIRLCAKSRLTKSNSHSPTSETVKDFFLMRRPSMAPAIDFDIDKIKALDVIDRVDTLRKL